MIGLVLAAGAGRRLGALTDDLPKTLLPVAGPTSVLELALRNMAAVGVRDVVVVTGHAEHRVSAVRRELEQRCGVQVELVSNDRALVWNNAYSLWCARDFFAEGVLLCNGDTVHPVAVERALLGARAAPLVLALDAVKPLADEEMKVVLDGAGRVSRITKQMDPRLAHGEYVGLSLLRPDVAQDLGEALERTWQRDPELYYEDAYQDLVDRGVPVHAAPVGALDWVEVDCPADLARARELACLY